MAKDLGAENPCSFAVGLTRWRKWQLSNSDHSTARLASFSEISRFLAAASEKYIGRDPN